MKREQERKKENQRERKKKRKWKRVREKEWNDDQEPFSPSKSKAKREIYLGKHSYVESNL